MKHSGELLAPLGIAGSYGTSYIPGILASSTVLSVLDVPVQTKPPRPGNKIDLDADRDTGSPVGMLTAGPEGAVNAALLAASMLGNKYPKIREKLANYRDQQQSGNASLERARQVA